MKGKTVEGTVTLKLGGKTVVVCVSVPKPVGEVLKTGQRPVELYVERHEQIGLNGIDQKGNLFRFAVVDSVHSAMAAGSAALSVRAPIVEVIYPVEMAVAVEGGALQTVSGRAGTAFGVRFGL